jgi:hypothetical protein
MQETAFAAFKTHRLLIANKSLEQPQQAVRSYCGLQPEIMILLYRELCLSRQRSVARRHAYELLQLTSASNLFSAVLKGSRVAFEISSAILTSKLEEARA